jgi:hypothetical protein
MMDPTSVDPSCNAGRTRRDPAPQNEKAPGIGVGAEFVVSTRAQRTEKHYAHLAKSYVADEVRKASIGFTVAPSDPSMS